MWPPYGGMHNKDTNASTNFYLVGSGHRKAVWSDK